MRVRSWHRNPALLPTLIGPVDLTTRGKECRIKSDVKPKIAKSVAARVDNYCENFARFYEELGFKPRSSNKVVIRLFAAHEDFVEFFHRNHRGEDPPAAYFSPSLNGVVSYHDPDDPYLRQVLFHETSHQYMNRYADWAPKWANEGLAEYFEGWRLDADGTVIEKRPPFYDLLLLQKALRASSEKAAATKGRMATALGALRFGGHLAPEELVTMEREAFNDFPADYLGLHPYLHYATSWGLT
ncbi:MAG: hypothetical protein ACI8QZ_001448 [Chlamydiales bacterium]